MKKFGSRSVIPLVLLLIVCGLFLYFCIAILPGFTPPQYIVDVPETTPDSNEHGSTGYQGKIKTIDPINIDTVDGTLDFPIGAQILYKDEIIDVSGLCIDIGKEMIGVTLHIDPKTKVVTTEDRHGYVSIGRIHETPCFSSFNFEEGSLYVDGMPVTWNDRYLDKSVVCLGDSMTEGVGTSKIYYEWLTQLCGFSSVYSHGLGGSCIAPKVDEIPTWETGIDPFLERYGSMEEDADVVIVMGGVNDWCTGRTIGTIDDTGTDTFYGAMKALCDGLQEKYPSAQIFFFSNPQNDHIHRPANELRGTPWESNLEGYNRKGYKFTDYVCAMDEVCDLYGVTFYSLTDALPWGANGELGDHNGTIGIYGSDALHPNAEGHKLIALEMSKIINGAAEQQTPSQ